MKLPERIAILDDDPIFTRLAQGLLLKKLPDVDIDCYSDGVEALEKITTHVPDLMFLDLNMPAMNGWEFLEALAERTAKPEFPIYITSSSIDREDHLKAATHPFVQGFIEKPLTLKRISLVLDQFSA